MAESAGHPSAARPTLLEHATEWMRHKIHAHREEAFIVELVKEVAALKERVAELEGAAAKDGPVVVNIVHDAAPVTAEVAAAVVQVVNDAAKVAAATAAGGLA